MKRWVVRGRSCWGILLAGWIGVFISGCSVLPPTHHEPIRTFILVGTEPGEEPRQAGSSASEPVRAATLLVAMPQARPGFDTARMIYVSRDYEILYFALNQWVDTPARMIHPLLVQALEETGLWRVVQPPSPVRSNYRLDTQNLLLQQEFLHDPSRVRLEARIQLVDLNLQRIRGTREFMVVEEAPSDDPYGGVIAANRAMGIFLQQLREWLQACTCEPSRGHC